MDIPRRGLRLAGFSLLLAAAGCGGDSSEDNETAYTASSLQACLKASGASVQIGDPAYVVGDASGGTFHVGVGGSFATVAFAVSEEAAAETERLAQNEFESFGGTGDGAHHRGNVAYWQLDESDASVSAVEECL